MTLEAFKAAKILEEEGISAEVLDLRSLKPLDKETIFASVKKTGKVLIADLDWKSGGFAAEIAAILSEELFESLKAPIKRITYPDSHSPTSWFLANHYFPGKEEIVASALQLVDSPLKARKYIEALITSKMAGPQDVPDPTFTGPF